jgi:hypothetical protein
MPAQSPSSWADACFMVPTPVAVHAKAKAAHKAQDMAALRVGSARARAAERLRATAVVIAAAEQPLGGFFEATIAPR